MFGVVKFHSYQFESQKIAWYFKNNDNAKKNLHFNQDIAINIKLHLPSFQEVVVVVVAVGDNVV